MKILTLQQQAEFIGNSKKHLRRELTEARQCLSSQYRNLFKDFTFDFDNRRMVGNGVCLQWRIRLNPDQPESYLNQQTSRGVVTLEPL